MSQLYSALLSFTQLSSAQLNSLEPSELTDDQSSQLDNAGHCFGLGGLQNTLSRAPKLAQISAANSISQPLASFLCRAFEAHRSPLKPVEAERRGRQIHLSTRLVFFFVFVFYEPRMFAD